MAEFRHMPLLAQIPDAPSARYLVRMSGLPVFLAGLTCFFALLTLDRPVDLATGTMIGVALVALGLGLRAGRLSLVPITVTLCAIWIGYVLWTTVPFLAYGFFIGTPALALLALCVVQLAIIAIFAVSGLRGWLWLRRNR